MAKDSALAILFFVRFLLDLPNLSNTDHQSQLHLAHRVPNPDSNKSFDFIFSTKKQPFNSEWMA